MKTALGLALAGMLALSGCGDRPGALQGLGAALSDRLTPGAAPERVNMSAAQLRNFGQPLVTVELPVKNSAAALVRQDNIELPGGISTWVTRNGVAVTLDDGVLIGTAGLGNDLMGVEGGDPRRGGNAVRDHFQLAGDETVMRRRYFCDRADAGPAPVTVAGVNYATRLVTEDCASEGGATRFQNRYWIEGDGTIRRSRQWATPALGYLLIDDIHG